MVVKPKKEKVAEPTVAPKATAAKTKGLAAAKREGGTNDPALESNWGGGSEGLGSTTASSASAKRRKVDDLRCMKCNRTPKECSWGALDSKGRPIGAGCEVCVAAVVNGACMAFDQGMAVYHDSSHPEHTKIVSIVDACCNTLLSREQGDDVAFAPSSTVDSQRKQGIMNFVDVAFLSDGDLVKYTGLGFKSLGLTPITRENEDGCGTTQGVYVSMKDLGLDYADLMGLRKTRFWSETTFVHSEHSLTPDVQLCQDQGTRVFEYIRDGAMGQRPGGLKTSGIPNLHTLNGLKAKAANIVSKREAKVAEQTQKDGGLVTSDDDVEEIAEFSAPKLGSIASQPAAVNPKKRAKKKTQGKDKDREESPDAPSARSGQQSSMKREKEISTADALSADELKKSDPELSQVCTRLGYVPSCFLNLVPSKMFGAKLGRSLFQANRVLKTLQDAGALQARILQTRIKVCQAAQDLTNLIENRRSAKTFDKVKYTEHLNLMSEKSIPLPWEVACGVLAIDSADMLRGMIESKDQDDAIKFGERFADALSPNISDPEVATFDPTNPQITSLLLELMDGIQGGPDATLTICSFEPPDADVMENHELHEVLMNHRWEEVRRALQDAFASDLFMKAVTNAEQICERLGASLKLFHRNCCDAKSVSEKWELIGPIHDIYDRFHDASKAILVLLAPCPEMLGLSAKDTLSLIDYKGCEAFESSLQGTIQDVKFWRRQVDETNRVAATSKEEYPKLKAHLEEALASFNGGCMPEVWLASLAQTLPDLSDMRKGLKPGATKELEECLVKMISSVAKYITSAKTIEGMNMDHVTAFAQNLDLFDQKSLDAFDLSDHIEVLSEAHEKIEKWQANMAESIFSKKLEDFLDKCLQDAGSSQALAELDWRELSQLVACSNGLSDELQAKAADCLFLMVHCLDQQVGNFMKEGKGDLNASKVRSMEASLSLITKHSKHLFTPFLEKFLPCYSAGMAARDAIMKYKEMGSDTAQRLKRDSSNSTLASVCRHLVSFMKQIQIAAEALHEAKESPGDNTPQLVLKCLDLKPGAAFENLDASFVVGALSSQCKDWAGKIKETLGRLKGVSKGCEVGGENNWKQGITEEGDLDHVLSIAKGTLAKVEGNILGDRIKELEEVGKKVEDFLKTFAQVAQVLSVAHEASIKDFYDLEKIQEGSLQNKVKTFKALFAEGLFVYAISSHSKNSLPSARAQLSQIAGENIRECDVQVSLLRRARELTAET